MLTIVQNLYEVPIYIEVGEERQGSLVTCTVFAAFTTIESNLYNLDKSILLKLQLLQ